MNTEIPKGWIEGWDSLLSSIVPPPESEPESRGCDHHWLWLGETKDGMESAWRCTRCGLEVLQ